VALPALFYTVRVVHQVDNVSVSSNAMLKEAWAVKLKFPLQ